MKSNYNPYTVPEHFFENTRRQAMTRCCNRRRAVQYGVAAIVIAATLVITPWFEHVFENQMQETEVVSNNLAGMYEYDIFLQVNFTE